MRNLLNLFLFAGILALAGCSSAPVAPPPSSGESPSWGPSKAPSRPRVVLETNYGDITLELYARRAPESVKNFLRYVEEGHYDGMIFHRVIENVLVQGGGFDEEMNTRERYASVPLEAGLSNVRGSVAMARRSDPNSAEDQFFINLRFNREFNANPDAEQPGYAVFGRVLQGLEVAQEISEIPTKEEGMHQSLPVKTAIIERAYRIK